MNEIITPPSGCGVRDCDGVAESEYETVAELLGVIDVLKVIESEGDNDVLSEMVRDKDGVTELDTVAVRDGDAVAETDGVTDCELVNELDGEWVMERLGVTLCDVDFVRDGETVAEGDGVALRVTDKVMLGDAESEIDGVRDSDGVTDNV